MIMMVLCKFEVAANLPQWIACCSRTEVVGCANPLPDHFVKKIEPTNPKILSFGNGEKKLLKFSEHVTGDEK